MNCHKNASGYRCNSLEIIGSWNKQLDDIYPPATTSQKNTNSFVHVRQWTPIFYFNLVFTSNLPNSNGWLSWNLLLSLRSTIVHTRHNAVAFFVQMLKPHSVGSIKIIQNILWLPGPLQEHKYGILLLIFFFFSLGQKSVGLIIHAFNSIFSDLLIINSFRRCYNLQFLAWNGIVFKT
jgi:hypothetical protein